MNTSFNQNSSTFDSPTETIQRLQDQIQLLERGLEASSARNRQLMAAMPQITWIARADGSIADFNHLWYEYTGYTVPESLNWGFLKAVHPEDRQIVLCSLQQASKKPQPYQIQCRLLGADGTYRWFRALSNPVVAADGEVIESVGTYTEIDRYSQPAAELENQPEFIKALLDNLSDGIVACDESGVLRLFNRASCEFHGLPLSPIPPTQWAEHYDLCHPDGTSMQTADIPLFRALNGELVRNMEMKIIPKTGIARTIEASGDCIFNSAGKKIGAVVVMRDITLRQRLEEERNRFFTLSLDMICIAGVDGYFKSLNPAFEKTLGYTREELISKPFIEFVHPEDKPATLADVEKLKAGEPNTYFENRYCCKNGEYKWLAWTAGTIIEEGLIYAIARDITTTKEIESKLYRREKELKTLLDNAPDVILRCNRELRYLYVNAEVERTTGMPASTLIGKTFLEVGSPPELCELWEKTLHQVFEKGEEKEIEFESYTLAGPRTYQSRVVPEVNKEGVTESALILSRDITELKQAEAEIRSLNTQLEQRVIERTAQKDAANKQKDAALEALRESNAILEKRNQELDQFAYVTSHDLKAPLRAIANLSQWIEEDIGDFITDETRHQMNLLRGRVHRMEALINALLQYSRAGRLKTKPEQVKVETLLAEVIDSLAPPPDFTIEVSPGMPTLVTEKLPLQQVFSNLIDNAIKHHPRRDGKVKISVQDVGNAYEFTVSDDGSGIAPQYHEKVFLIFQTLEARDKVENTGLGLALVKRIVDSLGGKISLESEETRGATFRFTWPK